MELRHIIAQGEPRATVLLLHGYAEHAGRYSELMESFAGAGYDVFSYDQIGHGKAEGPRAQADVAELIWAHREARKRVRERMRTEKLILFGHSMGGLVTASSALIDPDGIDGVVLTGPAFRQFPEAPAIANWVGYGLARLLPGLPIVKLDPSNISRDPVVVDMYQNDPLVYHGWIPLLTGASMAVHGRKALNMAGLWQSTLPLLVIHGDDDRLANLDGAKEFVAAARFAGASASLIAVPGAYHEVMKEPEAPELWEQILAWLHIQLSSGSNARA